MSAPRTRKAWRVTSVYLSVSDVNNGISFPDIRVLRDRHLDRVMPELPPEAASVSRMALRKLLHA